MSKADIVIGIIAIIGAVGGYRKGFLVSVFGLVGLILGCFVAFIAMDQGVIFLSKHLEWDSDALRYIAFFIIFIGVIIVVSLLAKSFRSAIDKTLLGSIDEVAGAVFGIFKSLFFMSIFIWIMESLHLLDHQWMSQGSYLYGFTADLAPYLAVWAGQWFPALNEIFGDPEVTALL